MKVKFYENIDDSLLKFAVIVSKSEGNGYFVSIKKETHMKYQEDTGRMVKQ